MTSSRDHTFLLKTSLTKSNRREINAARVKRLPRGLLIVVAFFCGHRRMDRPPGAKLRRRSGLGGCSQADRAEPLKSPPLVKGSWHIATLTGAEKISRCLDLLIGVTALGPHVAKSK
jgi:hypothetical protein